MIPNSTEVRFETTLFCNKHCVFCPREKLTRDKTTMSCRLFRFLLDKITKETDQYKICSFSGFGEPILDPELVGKIHYAHTKGMECHLLTNGSFLTTERFEFLQSRGLSTIRISYNDNSIDQKVEDIVNMNSTIKIILTRVQQDEDLTSWINYWKDRVHLVEVWKPHNWVDGKTYRNTNSAKKMTCNRPFSGPLQVQVDGTVNMCCFDYDGKLTLGNLNTQTLEEIFNSPMAVKIRECHNTGNFDGSNLICEYCDQRNVDKTGVLVYSSKYTEAERLNKLSTTYKDFQ